MVAKRLTFKGFVTDTNSFTPDQFAEAQETLAGSLVAGKLKAEHTIVEGFEWLPEALLGLFLARTSARCFVACRH